MARLDDLVQELNLAARLGVWRLDLGRTATLAETLGRLGGQESPAAKPDFARSLALAIKAVAAGDDHKLLIEEWLFALLTESRSMSLTGRRNEAGRLVGRSASSIRQTDQPQLLGDLARYLEVAPAGVLRSGLAARGTDLTRAEQHHGYRMTSARLRLAVNPDVLWASPATIEFWFEALREMRYFQHRMRITQAHWGLTHQSADRRQRLVPVGHPMRPDESIVCYRLDPPYRPGDRGMVRFRQRVIQPTRTPNAHDREYFERGLDVSTFSLDAVELSVTTPPDRRFKPGWFETVGFNPSASSLLPLIASTARARRFSTTIPAPSGDSLGVFVWNPRVVHDSER